MPEELFVLAILFVAFPWVLLRGALALRKAKSSGTGFTADDLREIVEDAVAQATEPLHDRIDTLEGLLMGDAAEGRIADALLDDEPERDGPARRRRRSARS